MTTKEMSDFLNSLWCWARCTEEEQRKLSEIADYLSNHGNEKNDLVVDCIDRQATLDAIIKRLGISNESYLLPAERTIYQQIKDMPSVTPQELKTGHWIEDAEQHHVEKTYHCSECGHGVWGEYEKTEYCGGCGAKMVEPQAEKEQEDGEKG